MKIYVAMFFCLAMLPVDAANLPSQNRIKTQTTYKAPKRALEELNAVIEASNMANSCKVYLKNMGELMHSDARWLDAFADAVSLSEQVQYDKEERAAAAKACSDANKAMKALKKNQLLEDK